jgi:hypothetical protein
VPLALLGIFFFDGHDDVDVGLDETEAVFEGEEEVAEVDEGECEVVVDAISPPAVASFSVSSWTSAEGLEDCSAVSDLSDDDSEEPVRITSWLTSTPTVMPAAMSKARRATPSHINNLRLLACCAVSRADLSALVRLSVLPPWVAGAAASPVCDIVGRMRRCCQVSQKRLLRDK